MQQDGMGGAEAALIKEINGIERVEAKLRGELRVLDEKRRLLARRLEIVRNFATRVGVKPQRRNALSKTWVEIRVVETLNVSPDGMPTATLYQHARAGYPSLNYSTFRSHLRRLQMARIVVRSSLDLNRWTTPAAEQARQRSGRAKRLS